MAMYLGSNKVEIGQSSGGGSSDFSTAEVTIASTAWGPGGATIRGGIVYDDDEFAGVFYGQDIEPGNSVTVILYKGQAMISASNYEFMSNISASGDIVDISEGDFIVTGDGTITATAQ